MASGPQFRMESEKVNLITQLLTTAISLLLDAVNPASLETTPVPVKNPRNKRHRAPATNGKGEDYEGNGNGTVVSITPLLRSPIDPNKEYDLAFVAKYLHMGTQTLRKRIKDNALTAEKKGNGRGMWVVTGEELIRFSNSEQIGDDQ